jgi:Domain of unknown function DUF11
MVLVLRRRLLVVAVALFLAAAGAAPVATADEGYVDLFVTVKFDNKSYYQDADVHMSVLVENRGTRAASGVVLRSTGDLDFAPWADLDESGPGIDLGVAEQRQLTVTAKANDTGADMKQVVEAVSAEPDRNPADNKATAESFVTAKYVDLTLTVYADNDGDGVADPGEGQGGVPVELSAGPGYDKAAGRTDENGVVRFPGIQGGLWDVYLIPRGGYIYDPYEQLRLRPGQNDIAVRTWHVDMTKLISNVSFDRPSYAVGDVVRERVTLTNTGNEDMIGIVAMCGAVTIGGSPENYLSSAEWGELSTNYQGRGAIVRAGETRTWEFTDVITQRMWDYGFANLTCEFTIPPLSRGSYAGATPAVPGGRGSLTGEVFQGSQLMPGITIRMLNTRTGALVAKVTSDGNGRFELPDVPAGVYEIRTLGPWRPVTTRLLAQIFSNVHLNGWRLDVEPGPMQLDPDAPPPPPRDDLPRPADPVPQASPAPHPSVLADTGADVAELTALGFLFLAGGALLLRARRPRRA